MNKWFGAVFAGLALVALFAAPVMAQDTIKVGIILPLTGSQASFGEIEKNSFDMALEEINAAGGINGTPLEFVYEDDTGRPEVGSSAAEKLITQDNVVMLGGGYSSSVCANVASTAESNAMPFLINTGSADNITEHGYEYVFRLNPPASEYPNATKSFLEEIVQPPDLRHPVRELQLRHVQLREVQGPVRGNGHRSGALRGLRTRRGGLQAPADQGQGRQPGHHLHGLLRHGRLPDHEAGLPAADHARRIHRRRSRIHPAGIPG